MGRVEGGAERRGEVFEGEDVSEDDEPLWGVLERDEDTRDESHRQEHGVGHRRHRVSVLDDRAHRQPES